ncbi:hypothetical protein [Azospirillum doebereinerae]
MRSKRKRMGVRIERQPRRNIVCGTSMLHCENGKTLGLGRAAPVPSHYGFPIGNAPVWA